MDWHNATQALLPTMMESRLKTWGPADIDTQQDCPFYNGRIPQEITDLIFEFALSPDTLPYPQSQVDPGHDFCIRYDHEPSDEEPEVDPVRMAQLAERAGAETELSPHGDLDLDQGFFDPATGRTARKKELGFDWFRPDSGRVVLHGHQLLRTCRRVYLHTHKIFEQANEVVIYSGREPPSASGGRDRGLDGFIWGLRENYADQLPKIRSIRWFPQMYLLVGLLSCRCVDIEAETRQPAPI